MLQTKHHFPNIFKGAKDFMPLNGTDYIEFYVSNAKQAAYFYKSAFGFESYAYAGLETGLKEYESWGTKVGNPNHRKLIN